LNFQIAWTQRTPARLGGLSFAREASLLLAWDESQQLFLWDRHGRRTAQATLLLPPIAAAISDDGNQIVAAAGDGRIWWFDRTLQLQFDLKIQAPVQTVALEPLGDYLAVSDRERRTHLFNRHGKPLVSWETPRALHHLAFVPGAARLLGAADFGFVGCFDAAGGAVWRDAPLTHVGAIASDGVGSAVLLACFSEGLRLYGSRGQQLGRLATPAPCRRAAFDYDGTTILSAGEDASLALLNRQGRVLETFALPHSASALALGALGDLGVIGLPTGDILAISIQGSS
jgi:WD40 repeat protein